MIRKPGSIWRISWSNYLGVGLLTLFPGFVYASDWPQWLGPNRDGASTETGLLARIPEDGLPELWRQPLGSGFSGLVIADDRLFTLFGDNDAEFVGCFALDNGRLLWRRRIGHLFYDAQGGDGPRATPTVNAGQVYAMSAHGNLVCLRAEDGKLLWVRSMTGDFAGELPTWGYAASPLLVKERVFVASGDREDGSLLALSADRGRVVWRAYPGKAGYASPVFDGRGAVPRVLFFTGEALLAVTAEQGRLLGAYDWATAWQTNAATLVLVGDDRVFITSSYGRGAALLRLPTDSGATQVLWRASFGAQFSTPVVVGDYIYGFHGGILTCLATNDGSRRWDQRGFGKGSLLAADGKLIILAERGRLVMAKADSGRFQFFGSMQVFQGTTWTTPALADGKLYLRGPKEMVCLPLHP